MDSDWQYLYKLNDAGDLRETNLLYTPYINREGNRLKMHFCIDTDYRDNHPAELREDLIDWFFKREVRFLKNLQHLSQTPKLYSIDFAERTVTIEWNKESLSHIVNDPSRDLDAEVPDWKDQLRSCLDNFCRYGYLKMTLYPHCFFVSKDKKIKTIDYYAVVPFEERLISFDKIKAIIGEKGADRFIKATNQQGDIDFKKFFEITTSEYLKHWWKDDIFGKILEELRLDDKLE